MIIPLTEEICCNPHCKQTLQNGNNIGGFKAHRTQQGNYTTGYLCKKCGNQSVPSTSQLRLYQQNQHYATDTIPETYHNTTNKNIEHKRQWANLTASLAKDDEKTNAPSNKKMPNWNQVLDRMEKKRKVGKE